MAEDHVRKSVGEYHPCKEFEGMQPSERVMHFIRRQPIVNRAFKRIACHCDCVSTVAIGSGMAGAASQTQLYNTSDRI